MTKKIFVDTFAGCALNALGMYHFSMKAFHAKALASCAMNALGVFKKCFANLGSLSVRQAREQFSEFAGTRRAMLLVSEAMCGLLDAATRWCGAPKRSAIKEFRCCKTHSSAFCMHRCAIHFGGKFAVVR